MAKEIEEMSKTLSYEELESRRYGKFLSYGGLVYKEFDDLDSYYSLLMNIIKIII